MNKQENVKNFSSREATAGADLWTNGLICAFEYIRGHGKGFQSKSDSNIQSANHLVGEADDKQVSKYDPFDFSQSNANYNKLFESLPEQEAAVTVKYAEAGDGYSRAKDKRSGHLSGRKSLPKGFWTPIGWDRVSELVQTVQVDADWSSNPIEFTEEEGDVAVADVAAPYWEQPVGPTWWCHVDAGHPYINTWLSNAQWLHPAIRIALRDENKLISERMKHLLYEVPVRVSGGLLFELLGQSAGDPFVNEDDIPIVLRSWQAQNFLITSLHVKGSASNINVLGITEVQDLLAGGGSNMPRTVHEVIAHLACRLARWDDRLFRKSIFGAADEVELKFMNRRTHEDMHLFTIILNQEIRWLSTQVIRVKWSLHAREEIVFELLQHLRGNATRFLLEGVRKSTREMIGEQEAVRDRLFTIQDVMQSTVRAWLQVPLDACIDFVGPGMERGRWKYERGFNFRVFSIWDQSLTVTHNLGVFGGCGLVLSIITGLFGINVDGIPGAAGSPYAFALFTGILVLLGSVLSAFGLVYLGLKKPIMEEDVEVRKLELQELVRMFQHEAESHAQVRKHFDRNSLPPAGAGIITDGAEYVLIG